MIRTVSVWLGSVVLALSAAGQVESVHVDPFDPSDAGYEPLPPNRVILDVFVDVAPTDVWTASGLHVRVPYDLYQGGRVRLLYAPTDDPNTAQPDQLVNPGYENRFFTSISKPRPSRGGVGRFENARVSIAGGYAPTNPIARAAEWDLNVAYFALPLETQDSPSVDGYIARIALDVDPWLYYPPWIFELATGTTVPTGALVIAEFKTYEALPGIGAATLDEPGVVGSDWFLYRTYVPEPTTGVCAIAMLCALRRLRREIPGKTDASADQNPLRQQAVI